MLWNKRPGSEWCLHVRARWQAHCRCTASCSILQHLVAVSQARARTRELWTSIGKWDIFWPFYPIVVKIKQWDKDCTGRSCIFIHNWPSGHWYYCCKRCSVTAGHHWTADAFIATSALIHSVTIAVLNLHRGAEYFFHISKCSADFCENGKGEFVGVSQSFTEWVYLIFLRAVEHTYKPAVHGDYFLLLFC